MSIDCFVQYLIYICMFCKIKNEERICKPMTVRLAECEVSMNCFRIYGLELMIILKTKIAWSTLHGTEFVNLRESINETSNGFVKWVKGDQSERI